jgi:hypothetical protein
MSTSSFDNGGTSAKYDALSGPLRGSASILRATHRRCHGSALNRLARARIAPKRLTPAWETGRHPRDVPVHASLVSDRIPSHQREAWEPSKEIRTERSGL